MTDRLELFAEQVQDAVEDFTGLAVCVYVREWECEEECEEWETPVYVSVTRKSYRGNDDPLFEDAVCDLDAANVPEQVEFVTAQVLGHFRAVPEVPNR